MKGNREAWSDVRAPREKAEQGNQKDHPQIITR